MAVAVMPVAQADKPLLWARMQDYIRELMPYESDTPDDGPYDYPHFDQYWREPDARWPFWGEVEGRRVAFALVRRLP
jgi:predicted acetyltransferase